MLWVRLGGHPHIVSARSVLPEGAQLVVFMDYVAPDHAGRITLQDHPNLCNDPLPGGRAEVGDSIPPCVGTPPQYAGLGLTATSSPQIFL